MTDADWRQWAARLSWVIAATFLAGSFLVVLLSFTVPMGEFPPDATFVDHILGSFEDQQARWIPDLGSSLFFAAGFTTIAALGATLRHVFGSADPRSMLATVAFLIAGAVGTTAQLVYVGGTEIATNPQYCDCGFLAEEIISRGMIRDVLGGIVSWMTDGFVVLFAVGLLAIAAVAGASGTVPFGWVRFTRLLAIVGLGDIGRDIARMARGLGMRVLGLCSVTNALGEDVEHDEVVRVSNATAIAVGRLLVDLLPRMDEGA